MQTTLKERNFAFERKQKFYIPEEKDKHDPFNLMFMSVHVACPG